MSCICENNTANGSTHWISYNTQEKKCKTTNNTTTEVWWRKWFYSMASINRARNKEYI